MPECVLELQAVILRDERYVCFVPEADIMFAIGAQSELVVDGRANNVGG